MHLKLISITSSLLYLVEVLLDLQDVLLHSISIPLQLLDESAQFCRRSSEGRRQREKLEVITASYVHERHRRSLCWFTSWPWPCRDLNTFSIFFSNTEQVYFIVKYCSVIIHTG